MKVSELNLGVAIAGLLVAIGLGQAGVSIAKGFVEMRRAERSVTVKGLAERDVAADSAVWRIPFRGVGENNTQAIDGARAAQAAVRRFALEAGLEEGEIVNEPFSLRIERRTVVRAGAPVEVDRYLAIGAVRMVTEKVDEVAEMTTRTAELLEAGVLLGADDYAPPNKPEFRFTGLNAIKPELIAEATKAARASAEQFAEDSGSRIGGIADANQGIIRILARDGGFEPQFERDKRARVVSTVRYYLED
ncbi:MAG: SIMPL domain-containing protein [Pseudomonadota bacterium]